MEISIRSKDCSFPEAFDVVGGKLVPAWTGKEIEARKCHSPEDVKSMASQPEGFVQYVEKKSRLGHRRFANRPERRRSTHLITTD